MSILDEMPMPAVQSALLVLLMLVATLSVWTAFLYIRKPGAGKGLAPARCALAVAALSASAALCQFVTARWFSAVMEEYDDIERYPAGPPSFITRSIIDNPDAPTQSAIRDFLFYDPSLAVALCLWACAFLALSLWRRPAR